LANVTAGFISACGAPAAIAVKTPKITPNPHPVAIAVHPAPSALDSFNRTLATTPEPKIIKTMVPKNSPNKFVIVKPPHSLLVCLAPIMLSPSYKVQITFWLSANANNFSIVLFWGASNSVSE